MTQDEREFDETKESSPLFFSRKMNGLLAGGCRLRPLCPRLDVFFLLDAQLVRLRKEAHGKCKGGLKMKAQLVW